MKISAQNLEKSINMYSEAGIVFGEVSEADFRAPKKVDGTKMETIQNRLKNMVATRDELIKDVSNLHVVFSEENSKMGKIPSVSLIPVVYCGNCKACGKLCYDVRNDCCYPSVQRSRAINAAILEADRDRYFEEIEAHILKKKAKFFRWHVGGDIVDMDYFDRMMSIAKRNPEIKFLLFTKMFSIVNEWVDKNGELDNVNIVFSNWVGQKQNNPHKFFTSNPIFVDGSTTAHDGAKLCNHNCSHCAEVGQLCWNARNLHNEEVVFPAH